MPRVYFSNESDLVKNLVNYANNNQCACTACRMLREWTQQLLEEQIETLTEQLKMTQNP